MPPSQGIGEQLHNVWALEYSDLELSDLLFSQVGNFWFDSRRLS